MASLCPVVEDEGAAAVLVDEGAAGGDVVVDGVEVVVVVSTGGGGLTICSAGFSVSGWDTGGSCFFGGATLVDEVEELDGSVVFFFKVKPIFVALLSEDEDDDECEPSFEPNADLGSDDPAAAAGSLTFEQHRHANRSKEEIVVLENRCTNMITSFFRLD
jgi:hypothetical protein